MKNNFANTFQNICPGQTKPVFWLISFFNCYFEFFLKLIYWNSLWTGKRRINILAHLSGYSMHSIFSRKRSNWDMTNAFPFWHSSLLFLLIDMKARLVPGSLGLGITLCWTRCGSCVNMVLKDWKQSVSDFAVHFSEIIVAHSVVTRKSI